MAKWVVHENQPRLAATEKSNPVSDSCLETEATRIARPVTNCWSLRLMRKFEIAAFRACLAASVSESFLIAAALLASGSTFQILDLTVVKIFWVLLITLVSKGLMRVSSSPLEM